MRTPLAATLLTFLAATLVAAPKVTTLPSSRNPVPAFVDPGARRVVLVILENGSPVKAAAQSFMRDRAAEGTVLTQYFGVAHPSQPNYVALISGSTAGALTDDQITLTRPHIGNALGTRWRVYADDYPATAGHCNLTKSSGLYVRRHVPFLSFRDVQNGSCAQIVALNTAADPVGSLRRDIANGTLPDFALVIPNLEHDGHSPSNVGKANAWLVSNIAPLLSDPKLAKGTVFVLTFDEDDTSSATNNRVFAVLWGDHVKHGTRADIYDHEDLLATIAALLHVTPPPFDEPGVRPIGGIWK